MTSAQRKLAWGVERVKALQEEVEAYRGRGAYVFDAEREARSPTEVHFRCFATEVEPPPDHWPLVAGDAIQNLRAALDHCVWAAWRSVPTNTGDGNHTQFVTATKPKGWKDQQRRLEGVPASVQALVERWQPYNRWPKAPEHEMLALLAGLSNTDKHRTLTAVTAAVHSKWSACPTP